MSTAPTVIETVEHFLFHCPLYHNIRTRLLPLASPAKDTEPFTICSNKLLNSPVCFKVTSKCTRNAIPEQLLSKARMRFSKYWSRVNDLQELNNIEMMRECSRIVGHNVVSALSDSCNPNCRSLPNPILIRFYIEFSQLFHRLSKHVVSSRFISSRYL